MLYVKQDGEISEFDGVDILIFPLKKDELELLAESKEDFSKYINLQYEGIDLTFEDFKEKFNLFSNNDCDWAFNSMWVIASLFKRTIVGYINFVKIINNTAEIYVEINKLHQNQGYATLAVELLLKFAKNNNINKIVVKINEENKPAIKVFEKNNFKQQKQDNGILFLEKEI